MVGEKLMASSHFKRTLIALGVAAVSAFGCFHPHAVAQKKISWEPAAKIDRVRKPDRQPQQPLPVSEKATLLTLQWRMFMRQPDNTPKEVNPAAIFHTGDRLRLGVTTNQSGYLYIVSQMEGEDGEVLFPDQRVNGGKNQVKKDTEYLVPDKCTDIEDQESPDDCWLKLDERTGTENLIVIFSRDKITTLPNQAGEVSGLIERSVIEKLRSDSGQNIVQVSGALLVPGRGKARYATRVQNDNRKDNEELIAAIQFKHADR
ncbi:MAG TPA: DUF4384 domain-containing protein [Blastocatellia bacterium]|nr:DUF4384 domain-containing protein [Blastocatellia bacterium]